MPLAQAVEILKKQCTVIKNVQLVYSEQVLVYNYVKCIPQIRGTDIASCEYK